jgi:hypothetical protein
MSALWQELDRRQRVLARLGAAMAVLLALCLLAMAVDARQIGGVSVWAKPAKFAASFWVWLWTLAWAWGALAPAARRGFLPGLVVWGTVASGLYEQVWITLRGALGQPSHFATDTLGAIAYGPMGLFALLLVAMAALAGVLVLWRGDPAQPRAWRLAVGFGLVIGGVAGGVTGASISALGSPLVGGVAGTWPPFFWSATGGDLRVAHFLGIHAMQLLPGLALLGAGVWGVALGALGWAGLVAAAYALALAGVPLSP